MNAKNINSVITRKPEIIITSIKPMISTANLQHVQKKIIPISDEEILEYFQKDENPLIQAFQYLMGYKDCCQYI